MEERPARWKSEGEHPLSSCALKNNKLVEQEKLITDFGRIRDVAMGADGFVYIVLEHNEIGSLWRIVPG